MIIRRKNDLSVSRWSGGTTTELFIYPESTSYANRDFDIRISTATVETAVSEFTDLPGFYRILMILEGRLTLRHQSGELEWEVRLEPFEKAYFPGSWHTTGAGKVTDFNVMYSERYTSEVMTLELDDTDQLLPDPDAFRRLIYVSEGSLEAEGETLSAGDVFVSETTESPVLTAVGAVRLILVRIQLPEF